MPSSITPKMALILGLIFIYLLTWLIEAKTMVSGDISLDLHESMQLLAGGVYGKDFFEVNPPLFLYLYMPSIIMAQYVPCHLFTVFHGYIFLVSSLSLLLCYPSIRRIFPDADWKYSCFLLLLAFILFLLPLNSFGQREHLLVVFTLPYLTLMICRLEGNQLNPILYLIIGLIAGLGFALKPFFCLTLVMIELYYLYRQRCCLAWARLETLAIGLVFIVYITCVFLFHQSYLTLVVPMSLRLYYQSFGMKWSQLLLHPILIFCLLPVVTYFMQRQNNANKNISIILVLGILGFVGSYLMQRTLWYYHLYPAYALALLLNIILLFSLKTQQTKNLRYFITAGAIFYFLYSIPVVCINQGYQVARFFNQKSAKLIQFVQQYALHQPVYFLNDSLQVEYPLIDYAQALHSSQFPSLWWIYGYMNQVNTAIKPRLSEQLQQDRAFFLQSITNELKTHKPKLIFVGSGEMAPKIKGHRYNYISDFSEYSEFRKVWKNYQYMTVLDEPSFYHFEVYRRI